MVNKCVECVHKIGKNRPLFVPEIWVCAVEKSKDVDEEFRPCFELNKDGKCSKFKRK